MRIEDVIRDGKLRPDLIAEALHTSEREILGPLGAEPADGATAQARLRDMLDILSRVADRFASPEAAFAWYRTAPLSGFGDLTAAALVAQGRSDWVHDHLDHVVSGGYA